MNRYGLRSAVLFVLFATLGGIADSREPENRRSFQRGRGLSVKLARKDSTGAILFRSIRVFDGKKVIPKTDVLVRAGRIVAVQERIVAPSGAQVIEGKGRTLLPGFIDSHTHAYSTNHLKQAVIFGVTTEMDMAGLPQFARQMRRQQSAGQANDRADLYSAGTPLTAAGGHPTQFRTFRGIPTINETTQIKRFIDDRLTEGSDYIKIMYDDSSVFGFPAQPTLNRKLVASAIKMAHSRNKLIVGHIVKCDCAREALEDGINGLVHILVDKTVDESLARLAARKKAFVIPTLAVMEGDCGSRGGEKLCQDTALSPYLTSANVRLLRQTFPKLPNSKLSLKKASDSVRILHKAGVTILAGSDCPNPGTAHGCSLHREVELLVMAGLTPVESLRAATSAPAAEFGLKDRGQVAKGYRADLILVTGDPTKRITDTRRIVGVWKAGHKIDRESYRASTTRSNRYRGRFGRRFSRRRR